jgi:hypothetical protein
MDTIKEVWNGHAGLAKTYWIWGVLSGIPWAIVFALVTPGSLLAMMVVLTYVAYIVIVNVGVWRAASLYQGAKVWAALAKASIILAIASFVIGTLAAIIIPSIAHSQKQSMQPKIRTDEEVGFKPSPNQGQSSESNTHKRFLTDEDIGLKSSTDQEQSTESNTHQRLLTDEEVGFKPSPNQGQTQDSRSQ